MFTVADLRRSLNGYDDDIPIMLESRYEGYDPMGGVEAKRVFFQGYHAESGGWGDIKRATTEQLQNGHILVVIIKEG
jgi:hypothetical protein